MRGWRGGLLGAGVGLGFSLSFTVIALGDPAGWAAWRVFLVTSPAVFVCCVFGWFAPK